MTISTIDVRSTYFTDLGTDGLELVRPLFILIEDYGDKIEVTCPELQVGVVDTNEADALAVLKQEIADLYQEVWEQPTSSMYGLPLAWKTELTRSIRRLSH